MEQDTFLDAYRELFLALQKGGLSAISQTAYELLQHPILITDTEFIKLAQYPDKPLQDPIWDTFNVNNSMTSPMVREIIDDSIMEEINSSELPTHVCRGIMENIPRLVGTVKINGVIEGYVTVFFNQNEYTELQIRITQLVCQTVALEMQNKARLQSSQSAILRAFINTLFQGNITTKDELSQWMKRINGIPGPRFCVAVIGGDQQDSFTVYYLKKTVENSGRNIYCTLLENRLYILFTEIGEHVTFSDFIKTQTNTITEILVNYNLAAGTSDIFDELVNLDNYKYQAERALMVGMESVPGRNIYYYRDFVLENIISHLRETLKPINFIHPAVDILRLYDRKNGTEYLQTLRVYITSNCSHSNTSKKMHIHRNTLFYRLNKINELTGLLLDDERVYALLLCNFYLLEDKVLE